MPKTKGRWSVEEHMLLMDIITEMGFADITDPTTEDSAQVARRFTGRDINTLICLRQIREHWQYTTRKKRTLTLGVDNEPTEDDVPDEDPQIPESEISAPTSSTTMTTRTAQVLGSMSAFGGNGTNLRSSQHHEFSQMVSAAAKLHAAIKTEKLDKGACSSCAVNCPPSPRLLPLKRRPPQNPLPFVFLSEDADAFHVRFPVCPGHRYHYHLTPETLLVESEVELKLGEAETLLCPPQASFEFTLLFPATVSVSGNLDSLEKVTEGWITLTLWKQKACLDFQ
ncbi:hypothetical protein Pelo_18525 [Pelomyxa schiedti]|nr:hypothetical protein Pelo_18525 [Pelomyxa schiedti]